MITRVLAGILAATLGVVGLASLVVCGCDSAEGSHHSLVVRGMPPECPMWRAQAQAPVHDCCEAPPTNDGLTNAPCHPTSAPAVPADAGRVLRPVSPPVMALVHAPLLADMAPWVEPAPIPSSVPRFLLTHALRL